MMLRNAGTKWLWDARRSTLVWALAVSFVGGLYAAFWPTMDDPGIQDALASYPEGLLDALNYTDISTSAGYLTATVYGLVVSVLLLVYSVSTGSRTIAGDEEAGTLDLVLAHPVSRVRLAVHRFAAFLAGVAIIAAVFWLVMVLISKPAHLDGISGWQFAAMHIQLILFASFYGAVAYAVGAATGNRAVSLGVGAAAGVLGYLANGIIPQVEGLEWVENLSPFHWLVGGDPLRNGIHVGHSLLMAGLVMVLVAVGTWGFNRRDIAV